MAGLSGLLPFWAVQRGATILSGFGAALSFVQGFAHGGWRMIGHTLPTAQLAVQFCPILYSLVSHIEPWDFCPFRGTRVGEAALPGPPKPSFQQTTLSGLWGHSLPRPPPPDPHVFTVCVANPTSILGKATDLLSLQADLLLLAETSAVLSTQRDMQCQLHKHRIRCFWSPPADPHYAAEGRESRRGHAVGTAICTTSPAHLPFAPVPVPANHPDAAALNQDLFSLALERVGVSKLPVLLGLQLPCWRGFQNLGFQELHQLYAATFRRPLPHTCRNATSWDTLLMSPTLVSLFLTAEVDVESHIFDSHAPVHVRFRMPEGVPALQRWRLPETWASLRPDPALVEHHYSARRRACPLPPAVDEPSLAQPFRIWAADWESAVDAALRDAHAEDPCRQPFAGLPRRFRGRCKAQSRRHCPCPALAKKARCGDYDPPEDAVTVQARQCTRQVRRVDTFIRALKAAAQAPSLGQLRSLAAQWKAISKAPGFAPNFPSWVLRVAHFSWYPHDHPPLDWLQDLVTYLRFHCAAIVRQQAALRKEAFRLRTRHDEVNGSARPQEHPPLQALQVDEVQTLALARTLPGGRACYHCSFPTAFRPLAPAALDGQTVTVEGTMPDEDSSLPRLLVLQCLTDPPAGGQLSQSTAAVTPPELCRKFQDFWYPVWNRDNSVEQKDVCLWQDFLSIMPEPLERPVLELPCLDSAFWEQALKAMPPHRATGVCGVVVDELKVAPPTVIADLARHYQGVLRVGAFPFSLCKGSVSCVPKTDQLLTMSQCRPITVYSALWRLFASGLSKAVLQDWTQWFAVGVMGAMPHRSSRDASLTLELTVESCLRDAVEALGFAVDLSRFFNLLPRAPLFFLLHHLQVPEPLLHVWETFLGRADRFPNIGSHMGVGIPAGNGVPEGCPLSILAQAAVCWHLLQFVTHPKLSLVTYVDNWGFTAYCRESFVTALQFVQIFCAAYRLIVNWQKSYAWALTPANRAWIRSTVKALLPDTATLDLVNSVKDLGTAFRFRKGLGRGTSQQRLDEAFVRLKKLEAMPRYLQNKLLLLQQAIWPAAFFALEGHLLPTQLVDRLRSAASRSLLGRHSAHSPLLALSVLAEGLHEPECFLLAQSLRALARALRVMPAAAQLWIRRACADVPRERVPSGPASALAGLLLRNSWELREDGVLTGPAHWRLDLHTCTSHDIAVAVQGAWCHCLPEKLAHRNGFLMLGAPCPGITSRVLQTFPHKDQRSLARSVTGGYLSPAAKAQWNVLETPTCEFCGQVAPKRHQLLDCPAFAAVRARFASTLRWVQDYSPHWLHGAFAVVHEQESFLRLLWSTRQLPAPPSLRHLVTAYELQRLDFFTDGTCAWPDCPQAAHAAWAVVLNLRPHEAPAALRSHWLRTGQPPAHFVPVVQGLVPCCQSIPRAELCGVQQAVALANDFPHLPSTIGIDAASALGVASRSFGVSRFHAVRTVTFGRASPVARPVRLCTRWLHMRIRSRSLTVPWWRRWEMLVQMLWQSRPDRLIFSRHWMALTPWDAGDATKHATFAITLPILCSFVRRYSSSAHLWRSLVMIGWLRNRTLLISAVNGWPSTRLAAKSERRRRSRTPWCWNFHGHRGLQYRLGAGL